MVPLVPVAKNEAARKLIALSNYLRDNSIAIPTGRKEQEEEEEAAKLEEFKRLEQRNTLTLAQLLAMKRYFEHRTHVLNKEEAIHRKKEDLKFDYPAYYPRDLLNAAEHKGRIVDQGEDEGEGLGVNLGLDIGEEKYAEKSERKFGEMIEAQRKIFGKKAWDEKHLIHKMGTGNICGMCLELSYEGQILRESEVGLRTMAEVLYKKYDEASEEMEEIMNRKMHENTGVNSGESTENADESTESDNDSSIQDNMNFVCALLNDLPSKLIHPGLLANTTPPSTPKTLILTPLEALAHWLKTLFATQQESERLETASLVWENIWTAVGMESCTVDTKLHRKDVMANWNDWWEILSLMVVVAARKEEMRHVMDWIRAEYSVEVAEALRKGEHERNRVLELGEESKVIVDGGLGDQPKRKSPPSDLRRAWDLAKSEALLGKTTMLAIKLTDLHDFVSPSDCRQSGHSSYTHGIIIGVAPEGCRKWQGWGPANAHINLEDQLGNSQLRQWIMEDGTDSYSTTQVEENVAALERFMGTKVYSV